MPDEPVILVVEDEPDLADLYADWLDEEYAVRTAYDGQTALDRLTEEVDVVFLDRRMADVSGDRVLERLRERGVNCRVAMLTAVDPDFDIIEMGFDEYLTKPVTASTLVATADRLLTRATYTEKLDEYLTLVAKRSALQAEKSPATLAASEEYARLEDRIERISEIVDPIAREFDNGDMAAVLSDLSVSS